MFVKQINSNSEKVSVIVKTQLTLNPTSAGVLENQDMLGEGQFEFFIEKSSYIVKMKNNTFLKSPDHAISNMQKFLQNFK